MSPDRGQEKATLKEHCTTAWDEQALPRHPGHQVQLSRKHACGIKQASCKRIINLKLHYRRFENVTRAGLVCGLVWGRVPVVREVG